MYQLKLLIISIIVLFLTLVNGQNFRSSALENFLPLYKIYRGSLLQIIGRTSENVVNMRRAKQLNMLQKEVPPSVPFPCNVTGFRSKKRPNSVHQLRPGDIDVIGALGDSLTAGFGLVATNVLQVFMENRGLSWSIGGQGTWRQYLTLPNILKEFNPNLIGYSTRDSFSDDRASQFNPAEGGAISSEIPYMTKILLKRITNDKRVNVKKDWKLITIMVGANDFCLDVCFHDNMTSFLEKHRHDFITVLRIIRDNLPRTIVNLVSAPQLRVIVELKNQPEQCQLLHELECYCLFADQYKEKLDMYFELIKEWQKIDNEITNMPEFNQNDFTVIYQPFIHGVTVPYVTKDLPNWSFLSSDCFHLSQKMNARAANALWNNMLEKVGQKSVDYLELFHKFLCPTEEQPYIFTVSNS